MDRLDFDNQLDKILSEAEALIPNENLPDLPFMTEVPDVHDYYRNFCLAIDGQATQLVTHPQMRRVMRVMEACFESDRLGQAVKFDDQ